MTPTIEIPGVALAPQSVASSATAAVTIDTYVNNQVGKADFMALDVVLGTAAATSAMLALAVVEGDTTVVSNMTAIAALTGGTNAGNFTLPTGPGTSGNALYRFLIDLRKRKRYLRLSVTPGTTQQVAAFQSLRRLNQSPAENATAIGIGLFVQV